MTQLLREKLFMELKSHFYTIDTNRDVRYLHPCEMARQRRKCKREGREGREERRRDKEQKREMKGWEQRERRERRR